MSSDVTRCRQTQKETIVPESSMRAKRRTILKGLLQGGALLGAPPALLTTTQAVQAATGPVKIQQYKPLGSTDMRISDISFGASRLRQEPELVSHALELGINYFDSAESYYRRDFRGDPRQGAARQARSRLSDQ